MPSDTWSYQPFIFKPLSQPLVSLGQWFSKGGLILPPGNHSAMSGDIWILTTLGHVVGRGQGCSQHLIRHGRAPTTQNHPAQNRNSAEVEKAAPG